MNKTDWILLGGGALLTTAGLVILQTPSASLLGIAFILCLAMLIFGIHDIIWWVSQEKGAKSKRLLVQGVMCSLCSLWHLVGSGSISHISAVFPFLFAIWMLVQSIYRLCYAVQMQRGTAAGIRNHLLGVAGTLTGFLMLYFHRVAPIVLCALIAILLLYMGALSIRVFLANKLTVRKLQ